MSLNAAPRLPSETPKCIVAQLLFFSGSNDVQTVGGASLKRQRTRKSIIFSPLFAASLFVGPCWLQVSVGR